MQIITLQTVNAPKSHPHPRAKTPEGKWEKAVVAQWSSVNRANGYVEIAGKQLQISSLNPEQSLDAPPSCLRPTYLPFELSRAPMCRLVEAVGAFHRMHGRELKTADDAFSWTLHIISTSSQAM